MSPPCVLTDIGSNGVATITFDRPALHNAIDEAVIAEFKAGLRRVAEDPAARVVVIAGNGKSFCAGADLNWMKRMATTRFEDNHRDALALAQMLQTLYTLPKPTIARVHGAAYAGGLGLIAACDIALAAQDAEFCVAEVKIGLAPATIGPYLVRAIGERQARRYFLSAEVFNAAEAYRIGLVHEIVPAAELDASINQLLGFLVRGGPKAQGATKELIRAVADAPITPDLLSDTATRIASLRASDEGMAGLQAFFERKPALWVEALTRSKAATKKKVAKTTAKRRKA